MSRPDARGAPLLPTLAAFTTLGFMFGVWQVALPDLAGALDLTPGPLGAALSLGFVVSLPAMLLGGRLADRIGARNVGVGAGSLLALAFIGFSRVDAYWVLVGLLMVLLAASGVYDVAINASAIDLEQRSQRRVLPVLHAAFSGGGAAGAVAAGALVGFGIGFRLLYVGTSALIVAVMIAWLLRPSPRTAHRTEPGRTANLYRNVLLLVLAAVAGLSFLSEGAMESWSAIYVRSSLDLPALFGAAGVATFHGAMLCGRLATAGVAGRFGRIPTLRAAGLLAAAGMALALSTELPALILAGFLLVGLALAGVAPIAFSLAGDAAPRRAGAASAVITTIGYSGFVLGPGLVGGLAEASSLRLALGLIAVAGLSISGLTIALRRRMA